MAKNNFYVVKCGKVPGIYNSWAECQKNILGYSGAVYHGFRTMEEAEAWYQGRLEVPSKASVRSNSVVGVPVPEGDRMCNVYTDGSFRRNAVSFGIVVEGRGQQYKFYGTVDAGLYAAGANEAAELLGVLAAVQVAHDLGFTALRVVHDYTGVAAYYTGAWKARTAVAVMYCNSLSMIVRNTGVLLEFQQVRGHSGLPGNVLADKLATRAGNMLEMVSLGDIVRGTLTAASVPLCTVF